MSRTKFVVKEYVKVIRPGIPYTGMRGVVVLVHRDEQPPSYNVKLPFVGLCNFNEADLEIYNLKSNDELEREVVALQEENQRLRQQLAEERARGR